MLLLVLALGFLAVSASMNKVYIFVSLAMLIIPYISPVPIYDARGQDAFVFALQEIEQYRRLPMYNDPITNTAIELPANTLATVGYAVSAYKYNGSNHANVGKTAVSLNILFVIALGDIDRQLMEEISDRMPASC
jgi:hypothetical protein